MIQIVIGMSRRSAVARTAARSVAAVLSPAVSGRKACLAKWQLPNSSIRLIAMDKLGNERGLQFT
jgi:hypothetical protein